MKKHLFFILFLMALVLNTIPAVANDYLTIHFKDGHTERHFLKLVESISTSKYDMEGKLHDDYQTQRLVISGVTNTYPLADIDSISYHKVNEEKLKEEIEIAVTTIEPLFQQSSTVEEMETHIDEIKSLEGVEDVWREDNVVVVKFRDWYTLCITYPIVPQNVQNRTRSIANYLDNISKVQRVRSTGNEKPIKVAIAFQMVDDIRFSDEKKAMHQLADKYNTMGFDVHFIPNEKTGEKLDLDFYKRRIFDYNIVILETHGSYIGGKHGLFTGERYKLWEGLFLAYEPFDLDDIRYNFCYIKYEGDDEESNAMFKEVNEDYIRNSEYSFTGEGPHLVFIGACKTFKGDDILIRKHKGKEDKRLGSSAVADIFFEKGADVVMGYNHSCGYSSWAADYFFDMMLNGASQEAAFYNIPSNYKDETTEYKAALIDLINPNSEYDNPKSIFLFNTQTIEKSQQEIDDEIIENGDIKLQGTTSVYQLDKNPTGLKYGFRLGILPHVENQNEDQNIYAKEKRYSGDESYQVIFSAGAIADPGTTVYYRAFTYDGIHYNWGEEKSFTITPLRVSTSLLSLEAGWTRTVNITSGYGNYKVESSDEDVATVSVYDYTISINALKEGDATITVTDKSGQTATIKVTVIEESINTPAEAIDLGLPSGTLWASWNVGASKPEESGDYYAWGETEYKQDNCTVSTYSFCTDGDKNTCVSLGDIAGTQYDVAHVKWGDRWTIPTIEQAQELLDYCNFVWTKRNSVSGFNVIGQNGNTIFIPASGCRHGGTHQNDGVGIDLWLSKESETYNYGAAEMTSNHYGNKPEIHQNMSRYLGLFVRPVICSTDNPLAISLSNVSLPTGEEFTLDIISGNGDYKIDYVGDASKIFEVSVMDSKLTIKTLQVGDGKFIVADITGKMVTVTVNVTDISDQQNTYERNALVQLFKLTKGSYWLHKDNWCSSQSPAHWYGITYDEYNEHVKYIKLANNNLTGSISIKGFEKLYNIDIKGNNISSLTIDSCPTLDLGYGFRLDDITLDFLQINNCLYDMGQHFMSNSNIKKILFTNFQKCGRIFLQGVVSDEVVIKDCVFDDEGVQAEDNSAVKTMTVENSTIKDGRLGGDVDELVIKNCTIGDWWAIGAKSSITIINSYIEGHLVDCSGTPDEVRKYVYSVMAH